MNKLQNILKYFRVEKETARAEESLRCRRVEDLSPQRNGGRVFSLVLTLSWQE